MPVARTVSRVPLLRRDFEVPGKIARALLSVSARGFYEVHLNGQRVGDELLAPGYTSYHQHQQYQTFYVTALVREGTNALAALLGYGWYAGHMNLHGMRAIDGTFPQFLAQLDVELADGRKLTVATDGQWRSTLSGPVLYSDLLDGEGYDCRRELAGWDQPGFRRWRLGQAGAQPAIPRRWSGNGASLSAPSSKCSPWPSKKRSPAFTCLTWDRKSPAGAGSSSTARRALM